jgi:hypothetical protein
MMRFHALRPEPMSNGGALRTWPRSTARLQFSRLAEPGLNFSIFAYRVLTKRESSPAFRMRLPSKLLILLVGAQGLEPWTR